MGAYNSKEADSTYIMQNHSVPYKIDEEKKDIAIKYAQEKEQQAIIAIQNEDNAKQLAIQLKQEAEKANAVALQVINAISTSQENKQNAVDYINNLNDKIINAEYEVSKAIEERIKAQKSAEVALQRAKFADEVVNINNDINVLKISNTNTKNKFRFTDEFQLKCPENYTQRGTYCSKIIEISNSSFGNIDVEQFADTKKTNTQKKKSNSSFIIIIILILILVAFYFYYKNNNAQNNNAINNNALNNNALNNNALNNNALNNNALNNYFNVNK